MKNTLYRLSAGLFLVALLVGACAPAATPTPVATAGKACEVTDTGGVDDKSFNQTAYDGALQAKAKYNWEAAYLESQQQTDYEKNINEFLQSDCDLIITVGFLLGDATAAAAPANPTQKFQILDFAYDPPFDNVWAQVYAESEGAFMAGYVAAAVSKTGKVGTFGGINIPSVTSFMDGYFLGVAYYNEKHGASVEVLGWDPADREGGLFTGNFNSTDDGASFGKTLMDEGADIILPVAGPVGLGTAAAIKERGNAYLIGVDTDWTVSASEYADIILTSILKKLDVTVLEAIGAVDGGTFAGGTHLANLASGGIDLAPFGQFDSMVPSDVKAELVQIKADIIAGTIKTLP